MNYRQLTKHPVWKLLDNKEKSFLKMHLESPDPRLALRVRNILLKAKRKAAAQEQSAVLPIGMPITVPDALLRAKFMANGRVELYGEVTFQKRKLPVNMILANPTGEWAVLSGGESEELKEFMAETFGKWAQAHPNFMGVTKTAKQ